MDVGTDERIMLVSRDEQTCLVVSYKDIKACIESAFGWVYEDFHCVSFFVLFAWAFDSPLGMSISLLFFGRAVILLAPFSRG